MKKLSKVIMLTIALVAVSLTTSITPAKAAEDKDMYWSLMQECPDVKGTVVAWYPDGYHWIFGYSPNQWGADKVWNVGYDNYVQCFCPKKLEGFTPIMKIGVKTAWLKASNVSVEKQQQLLANGWLYLANGADVGLAPVPYLAHNSKWDCKDGCLQ